jgi:hypothetical protein
LAVGLPDRHLSHEEQWKSGNEGAPKVHWLVHFWFPTHLFTLNEGIGFGMPVPSLEILQICPGSTT